MGFLSDLGMAIRAANERADKAEQHLQDELAERKQLVDTLRASQSALAELQDAIAACDVGAELSEVHIWLPRKIWQSCRDTAEKRKQQ